MKIHPLAGKLAPQSMLVNVAELISAYYTLQPDVAQQAQRVAFGTSGTENIYKNYAESFIDESHPGRIQGEARTMAAKLL